MNNTHITFDGLDIEIGFYDTEQEQEIAKKAALMALTFYSEYNPPLSDEEATYRIKHQLLDYFSTK